MVSNMQLISTKMYLANFYQPSRLLCIVFANRFILEIISKNISDKEATNYAIDKIDKIVVTFSLL